MFPNVYLGFILLLLTSVLGSPILTPQDRGRLRQQKSEEILKYLNTSVNPCENFYEFTCGHYDKYKFNEQNVLVELLTLIENKKFEMLKKGIQATDTDADKKLKIFYSACKKAVSNENVPLESFLEKTLEILPDIESLISDSKSTSKHIDKIIYKAKKLEILTTENFIPSKEKLQEIISEFGKMPILEGKQWQEDEFDWMHVLAAIRRETDVSILIDVKIMPDFSNNSRNVVALVQPKLCYADVNIYLEETLLPDLISNFENVLYIFLEIDKIDEAKEIARKMVELEIALARAMQDYEVVPPTDFYALVSMDDLQKKYFGTLNARKFLKSALNLEPTSVMIQPKYLHNALKVIHDTPKRILANYIFFIYLLNFPTDVDELQCEYFMNTFFSKHLENMAYRKYFTGEEKKLIEILWPQMKSAFEETLNSPKLNWIDHGTTRQSAVEKLRAMKLHMTTYEEIDFNQKLAELNVSDHDVVANINAVLRLRGKEARQKINEPPQFKIPPSSSASYTLEQNVVHIPLSMLQNEAPWSLAYPFAVNFGSLGSILGHEILHGYDDCGRYYDGTGSSNEWWHPESLKQHQKHLTCFANQYKNYRVNGTYLPKFVVQAENVADNGGLQMAYAAYQRWLKSNPSNMETLPGLNFTQNQLFFISFSQNMCISTPYSESDAYPPNVVRVIGTLMNFDAFAEAFNCPKGNMMNSIKNCVMY